MEKITWEEQYKDLVEKYLIAVEFAEAGMKYIIMSPCDPDITPEQSKAWDGYQKAFNKYFGAYKTEKEE